MTKPAGTNVLYDIPGPRAKRISLFSSVIVGALLLLAAYRFIYRPLDNQEQFTEAKWGPLVNPNNEFFDLVWNRLGDGLINTLRAAAVAVLMSLFFGMLLAVIRIELKSILTRRFTGLAVTVRYALRGLAWLLNSITRVCVEIFRGLPVVITIFFVSRLGPEFGFTFEDPMWYVAIGLTIYNSVVIAEIMRSGMEGLPTGQREAAASLGLSSFQTTRMVLLPQAARVMLPALISQLVVVVKDTSLGALISYTELLNVGKQIIGVLDNPLQVYTVVAVIFIALNYTLSKLAQYVQRRLARSRGYRAKTPVVVSAAMPVK